MPCRPRLTELPVFITVFLSIPLILLAWQIGIDLETSFAGELTSYSAIDSVSVDRTRDAIQPIACIDTIEKNHRNSTDANRNRLFLRYIDEFPRYWISLHAKGYDKVRWGIMEHGRYYEQSEVGVDHASSLLDLTAVVFSRVKRASLTMNSLNAFERS